MKMDWTPLSEADLLDKLNNAWSAMDLPQRRLWEMIRIGPEKWQQHPYGAGNGFWVVALMGSTVVWYNDIENGFNRSQFTVYGTIDDYWCNPDELETTLQFLLSTLERGADLVHLVHTLATPRRSKVK
jgi:hypothetical protein